MGDTQNGQDEQTEWEGADIDTSKLVGEESRTVRDEAPDAGEGADVDADADGAADAEGAEVNDG